jgi:hypothetical protein
MDVFRLTYRVLGHAELRELYLDVCARHWTERVVIQTVIKHEFPTTMLPEMKRGQWKADQVLRLFGISDLNYTYFNDPADQWGKLDTEFGIIIPTNPPRLPVGHQ